MTSFHRRLLAVLGTCTALLLAVLAQCARLQLLQGGHYTERAQLRRRRVEFLGPERGRILDRHGIPLASTVHSLVATLDPYALDPAWRLACEATDVPAASALDRMAVLDLAAAAAPELPISVPVAKTVRTAVAVRLASRFPGLIEPPAPGAGPTVSLCLRLDAWRCRHLPWRRLAALLAVDPEDVARRVDAHRARSETIREPDRRRAARREPLTLAEGLDLATAAHLLEEGSDLPGLEVGALPRRVLPGGSLAVHLLGHMGRMGPDRRGALVAQGGLLDLRGDIRESADLLPVRGGASFEREPVGRSGLEAAFEDLLRGAVGMRLLEQDRHGQVREVVEELPPVHGRDLRLALDAGIQAVAEAALDRAVAVHALDPTRSGGAVVLLDARTGECLVLASAPRHEPDRLRTDFAALRDDPADPLVHRAVRGAYPPGSVMKVLVAAAALGEGVVDPSETVSCGGRFGRAPRGFGCHGHGDVALEGALAVSCNTYFYEMGHRLGVERLARWARAFGLGATSGLPLAGQEAAGLVPDPDWKRRRLGEPWYAGDTWNMAIGQGHLLATPLQVARLAAALATGCVPRPTLVRGEDPEGRSLEIPAALLEPVRRGMRRVVEAPGGTAAGVEALRELPMPIAAKTGTAQAGPRGSHAWFAGYAPADVPRVAFAVVVEHVGDEGTGALAAAPVAAEVLRAWSASQGTRP
ncbi:MAG: hypothetical protein HY722_13700 [Planctomycetes bacterium]|nr:hypothetical protein [Planctomycetota bacterium]